MKFILFILLINIYTTTAYALDGKQTAELIALVDDRQRNTGDYASTVFIDQKDKDGSSKAFEARVYRRDADDKWMILFTKPKAEAGKGYLRLEKNLFLYEPTLGKWERQTERTSIAGTSSRRDDFDESRLSEEFTAQFIADEQLHAFKVHRIKLTAKPGFDVANPIVELWIDQATKNILKRQEFTLNNKLQRTSMYPSWDKMFSPSKKAEVYVPKQIIVVDEIERDKKDPKKVNMSTIVLKDVRLDPLEGNMFTKAWIEKQSR